VIELRRLNETDSFEEITDLLHRAYAPLAARGMAYVATHQSADVTRDRCARGLTWVGILDGRIVATITLEPSPATVKATSGGDHYLRPGIAKFQQFAVDPALKGTGLGGRMMDLIEAHAKELGARELALDTSVYATGLIAMYGKRGYRDVGPIDWRPSTNYPSVVLSKIL
jgi:GNAT superfamily N-acetyltransferase